MTKTKFSILTLVSSEAHLIVTAMECAISNYVRMAANPDLPSKLADTFDGYAAKLKEFASYAQDAEHVEFSHFPEV